MNLEILRDAPPWEWPVDAGKTFLEILRDQRAGKSERLLAAELAGDYTVINDELAHALLSILRRGDQPAPLRAQSAVSLGPAIEQAYIDEFMSPEEVPISEETFDEINDSLRELYVDTGLPKLLRRRILEASVRAPQDWHPDAIRAAYASDDHDWKLTAVFGMRY